MDKTEFILASTESGEAVEKIVNVGLNVSFDEGVVNIYGSKSIVDALGKSHNAQLNVNSFNIRLKELQAMQPAPNEPDEQKSSREAKIAIYVKLIDAIKKATEKAVIELDKL